jgi:preprotein translocase subunit SecA
MDPVDSAVLRHAVAHAQRIIEGQNGDIRRTLWRYSHFVEQQRLVLSRRRGLVLQGSAPSVLQKRIAAQGLEDARRILGTETLKELERRLTLRAIDECWSEHLSNVNDIRDGIHLAEVGGMSPIEEFQKAAAASFLAALESVDDHVVHSFEALDLSSGNGILENPGLRGPSSTWTYLVSDSAFTDRLAAHLMGRGSAGFAANAALTGPLLLMWAISRKILARRRH